MKILNNSKEEVNEKGTKEVKNVLRVYIILQNKRSIRSKRRHSKTYRLIKNIRKKTTDEEKSFAPSNNYKMPVINEISPSLLCKV